MTVFPEEEYWMVEEPTHIKIIRMRIELLENVRRLKQNVKDLIEQHRKWRIKHHF